MCLLTCVVLLRQLFFSGRRKESHLKPFRRAHDDSTVLIVQAIVAAKLSVVMVVVIAAVVGGDVRLLSTSS
jgi:hypothetical protein